MTTPVNPKTAQLVFRAVAERISVGALISRAERSNYDRACGLALAASALESREALAEFARANGVEMPKTEPKPAAFDLCFHDILRSDCAKCTHIDGHARRLLDEEITNRTPAKTPHTRECGNCGNGYRVAVGVIRAVHCNVDHCDNDTNHACDRWVVTGRIEVKP
jgi:hypothetical protein